MAARPPRSTPTDTLFPHTPLVRSHLQRALAALGATRATVDLGSEILLRRSALARVVLHEYFHREQPTLTHWLALDRTLRERIRPIEHTANLGDRKSTRLNSSH